MLDKIIKFITKNSNLNNKKQQFKILKLPFFIKIDRLLSNKNLF